MTATPSTEPLTGQPVGPPPSPDEFAEGRRVVGGGLWAAASASLPLLGTAVLSVVMGRVLGPDLLGQQSLIVYVEAVLVAVAVGSFVDASVRTLAAAGDSVDVGRLVAWTLRGFALSGVVAAGVLATIGAVRPAERGLWWTVALCAVLDALGWSLATRWVAFDGWSRVGQLRLVSQTVSALLGILSVLAGFGVAGVLWAAVAAAALLAVLLRRGRPGPAPARTAGPLPRPLVRLWGSVAAAAALNQVVGQRIEFAFLGLLSTDAAIAQYSVPFALVVAATTAPAGVVLAAIPMVARGAGGDPVRMGEQLGKVWRLIAVMSALLVACLIGVGPLLVRLIYGPGFHEAARLVPALALSGLVTPLANLCAAYWAGLGRMRGPLLCGGAGGVVDLALALVLIPDHGAAGAVAANVCGQAVTGLSLVVYTWRRSGRFAVAGVRLAQTCCWSGAAALLAWAAGRAFPTWFGLVASAALVAVVLLTGGLWRGYVSPADGVWLRRVLPHRVAFTASWVSGLRPRERGHAG